MNMTFKNINMSYFSSFSCAAKQNQRNLEHHYCKQQHFFVFMYISLHPEI